MHLGTWCLISYLISYKIKFFLGCQKKSRVAISIKDLFCLFLEILKNIKTNFNNSKNPPLISSLTYIHTYCHIDINTKFVQANTFHWLVHKYWKLISICVKPNVEFFLWQYLTARSQNIIFQRARYIFFRPFHWSGIVNPSHLKQIIRNSLI